MLTTPLWPSQTRPSCRVEETATILKIFRCVECCSILLEEMSVRFAKVVFAFHRHSLTLQKLETYIGRALCSFKYLPYHFRLWTTIFTYIHLHYLHYTWPFPYTFNPHFYRFSPHIMIDQAVHYHIYCTFLPYILFSYHYSSTVYHYLQYHFRLWTTIFTYIYLLYLYYTWPLLYTLYSIAKPSIVWLAAPLQWYEIPL